MSRVPRDFHAELAEYSSLLRTIQSDDFDISKHLTRLEDRRDPLSVSCPASSHALDVDGVSGSGSHAQASKVRAAKRSRQLATRWPLLARNAFVTEWGLQDEIAVLVARYSRDQAEDNTCGNGLPENRSSSPEELLEPNTAANDDVEGDDEFEDEDEDDVLDERYISAVTASSRAFLARIFSLIAVHTPSRASSLQNRLKPISWVNIMELLSVARLEGITPSAIERIRSRLEDIYGAKPDLNVVAYRAEKFMSSQTKIPELDLSSLLSLAPTPDVELPKPRRAYKKRKYFRDDDAVPVEKKKRPRKYKRNFSSPAAISENEEDDDEQTGNPDSDVPVQRRISKARSAKSKALDRLATPFIPEVELDADVPVQSSVQPQTLNDRSVAGKKSKKATKSKSLKVPSKIHSITKTPELGGQSRRTTNEDTSASLPAASDRRPRVPQKTGKRVAGKPKQTGSKGKYKSLEFIEDSDDPMWGT